MNDGATIVLMWLITLAVILVPLALLALVFAALIKYLRK